MPLKLQVTKIHQSLTISALNLVKFGVFVIWWQNLTFQWGLKNIKSKT
jgi:hypothetical protein